MKSLTHLAALMLATFACAQTPDPPPITKAQAKAKAQANAKANALYRARLKQAKAYAKDHAKKEKERVRRSEAVIGSQDPIVVQGCITVYNIHSIPFGLLTNITSVPGLDAKIRNECLQTATVFLRIGYFNSSGGQFGDSSAIATVAPGAVYTVNHEMYPAMYHDILKRATILTVSAYAE